MKGIRQLGLGLALASVLLLSGKLPAQAGPTITDVPITDAPIDTDINGIDPKNSETDGYKDTRVQRSVARSTRAVNRQLVRGRLVVGGKAISLRVQRNLAAILRWHKPPTQVVERYANSISSRGGNAELSGKLVNSLKGLVANDPTPGQNLLDATSAYNEVIKSSSDEFVNNPPDEIKAIRVVLDKLVGSADSSAESTPQGAGK